jgi:hypothetical protein
MRGVRFVVLGPSVGQPFGSPKGSPIWANSETGKGRLAGAEKRNGTVSGRAQGESVSSLSTCSLDQSGNTGRSQLRPISGAREPPARNNLRVMVTHIRTRFRPAPFRGQLFSNTSLQARLSGRFQARRDGRSQPEEVLDIQTTHSAIILITRHGRLSVPRKFTSDVGRPTM